MGREGWAIQLNTRCSECHAKTVQHTSKNIEGSRNHLAECLENKYITPFMTTDERWMREKVAALCSLCFPGGVPHSSLWLYVCESFNYLVGLAAASPVFRCLILCQMLLFPVCDEFHTILQFNIKSSWGMVQTLNKPVIMTARQQSMGYSSHYR